MGKLWVLISPFTMSDEIFELNVLAHYCMHIMQEHKLTAHGGYSKVMDSHWDLVKNGLSHGKVDLVVIHQSNMTGSLYNSSQLGS